MTRAVVGLPPSVSVTLVSSIFINATPVGIWLVVAKVPEVGNVTAVAAVMVKVLAKAPDVVKLPPKVSVDRPLLTPVPPKVGCTTFAFQVPDVMVPRVVIEV